MAQFAGMDQQITLGRIRMFAYHTAVSEDAFTP